ncbi:MAG: hypothetical protein JST89_10260 [Cyanobacteria bacterium SZAS-4]|nr:hypothetical protein [Cyanobacteria bacterium SZAS-4]
MSFPNQTSLKSAIAELKEVVIRLHGADTEPVRLLGQIESCASEIETRANVPMVVAAQTLIVNPIVNPLAPPLSL